MTRRSRLVVIGAALLIAAACAGDGPTTPAPTTMSPDAGALFDSADSTCRGGWEVPNGKSC